MHLIGSSPNIRCPPNEEGLGTRGKLGNWCVYKNAGSESFNSRVKQIPQQGFIFLTWCSNAHLSRCQEKERGKKKISPLLQHQLILLLPLLFEIAGKLVPNWEEGAETDLFLTSLWFYWEGHGQFKEAEKREKRTWGPLDEDTRDREAFSVVMATDAKHQCFNVALMQIVSSLIVV